jgi:hypothetical protein
LGRHVIRAYFSGSLPQTRASRIVEFFLGPLLMIERALARRLA